jgi:DNA-binding transcriptional MerR regulator
MTTTNGSLTVEVLARRSGLPAHTIRYYTRRGLLTPSRNPSNDYRLYSEADLVRLRFIRQAKSIGFSLGDIGRMLTVAEADAPPRLIVQRIITRRVAENRRRLSELAALQSRMERAVEVWSRLSDEHPDSRTIRDLIEAAAM